MQTNGFAGATGVATATGATAAVAFDVRRIGTVAHITNSMYGKWESSEMLIFILAIIKQCKVMLRVVFRY